MTKHNLTAVATAALLLLQAGCCCNCATDDAKTPDAPPTAPEAPAADSLIDNELSHFDKLVFGADGEIFVEDDVLHMDMGGPLTGVVYNGEIADLLGASLENYEISFEAQRLQGNDFFVGLTFPVGTEGHVTLIMGGWGGGLVGLSSLDHADASMNPTTQLMQFEMNRWYEVRLAVTTDTIQVWLDGDEVISVNRADHERYSLRGEVLDTAPFGLCCYQTHAAYRGLVVKSIAVD